VSVVRGSARDILSFCKSN